MRLHYSKERLISEHHFFRMCFSPGHSQWTILHRHGNFGNSSAYWLHGHKYGLDDWPLNDVNQSQCLPMAGLWSITLTSLAVRPWGKTHGAGGSSLKIHSSARGSSAHPKLLPQMTHRIQNVIFKGSFVADGVHVIIIPVQGPLLPLS